MTKHFFQQRKKCIRSKRRTSPGPERVRVSASHLPTAFRLQAATLIARLERVLTGNASSCGRRGPPLPPPGRHVTAEKSRGKVTASPAPGLARLGRSDPVPPARPGDTFRSELARVGGAATPATAGEVQRRWVGRPSPAWSTLGTVKSLVCPKTTHTRNAAPRPASPERLRKGLTARPKEQLTVLP